jgi:hypothetical protein
MLFPQDGQNFTPSSTWFPQFEQKAMLFPPKKNNWQPTIA